MAALNGVTTTDFAVDMGYSLKRVLAFEGEALERIKELGALDEGALDDLVSWSGKPLGDVRIEFRDEVFVSRAVRNPTLVGCPVCLREDAEAHHGAAVEAMAMRGDWQLREASICVRHRHPLVFLWREMTPARRYDAAMQFRQIENQILSGTLERERVAPSPYDLWLDRRLEDGSDQTWLASCSLYAATTFCRLLGSELVRLDDEDADQDDFRRLHAARAKGFEITSQGEPAIRSALDALARRADGILDEPRKAFGKIFSKLREDYAEEKDFDPFREILRECILDAWPVAAGEDVLGEVVRERRLHSVLTASREVGIGTALLSLFLTEAGAIAPNDPRPNSRKTFDARANAALLAEIPLLVGPTAMCEAMGATKTELAALTEDGVIVARARDPRIKNRWRIAEGVALVHELSQKARTVDAGDPRWERIQRAHVRKGIRVGEVIAAVRSGNLVIGQCEGLHGYRHFVVQRDEIDKIAPQMRGPEAVGINRAEITSVVSAAEFGREVGLRDKGYFLDLIEYGHTPSTLATNPKTGQAQRRMTEEDIAAFHARFVTVGTLVSETGLHRNTLRHLVQSRGVRRFSSEGRDFGAVYLREDVEDLIPEVRRKRPD